MRTLLVTLAFAVATQAAGIDGKVKDGYADSNGVKIHYASVGSGPLIVMIHGFPGLLVYVARSDGGAFGPIPGGRDRPARI